MNARDFIALIIIVPAMGVLGGLLGWGFMSLVELIWRAVLR